MNRILTILLLFAGLMVGLPAYPADGNIYLTGHDLDYHCAFYPAPTQCNAFKIAISLARAGAPDPNKPVLFLDEGKSVGSGIQYQLALAADKIGLPASQYQVVRPTSTQFTGGSEPPTPPLALATEGAPNYSAIVIASHASCGGCDNTDAAVSAINDPGRTSDIRDFFAQGGGLVYLSGASGEGYYASVPVPYGVTSTSSTFPGTPRNPPPRDCISTPTAECYQLTPAGKSLGLTNADANCCETHNSFTASPPTPAVTFAATVGSATNANLISAEKDGASDGTPNDQTLYAVGASTGGQAAVLTFTPGHPSQVATFNCIPNPPTDPSGCGAQDAHSMKVSVAGVNNTFTIVLTATEVEGGGNCDPNDATDYDCRFAKFFGNPNNKVPLCYPYSHGMCVFYDISGAPPRSAYSSPVLEYIAWNNVVFAPPGYLSTPHMYDDPSDDANNCHCYPTTTPGFPYPTGTPEDNQYVFDITTFYKDDAMQVGKDPGTGGRTTTFNQFGIAFPPSPTSQSGGDGYKWISPLSNIGVETIKKGNTLPVKFQLRDSTRSIVSNAVVPPNFVRIAVLDNNGVSQPVLGTGAFTYDPTKQQYQFNLATSPYATGITFTIVVNSNLFSEQIAKFKTSK